MELAFVQFIGIFIRVNIFMTVCKNIFPLGTPMLLKSGFSFILSYILYGGIVKEVGNGSLENYNLILIVVNEFITGYILATVTNIAFDMLTFAGSLIDNSMGLGMASIYDASVNNQISLSGRILYYTTITIYIVSNGHHILIKGLNNSFKILGLGKNLILQDSILKTVEIITNYFFIGVKIALPVIFILLMTEICMGLVSRVVPQINVMVLGVPVKILVGLSILIIGIPIFIKLFLNILNLIPDTFEKILAISITSIFSKSFIVYAQEEKTEEATPKKRQDAKKKGQVAKSKDVPLAITMAAAILLISAFGTYIMQNFSELIVKYLSMLGNNLSNDTLTSIKGDVIINTLLNILIFVVPIMICGVIGNLMQTGFLFTGEGLKPSLGKLNPLKGFKRMFSKRTAFETIKNIILILVITCLSYIYMQNNIEKMFSIVNYNILSMGSIMKEIVIGIFSQIAVLLVILAAADYFVQYRMHNKELKMTKYEVKQEYKENEGDPQIKSRIKQKQREMSQRRMMSEIPSASAIITNPTHFAVAIKYEEDKLQAPVVVAKGKDLIAQKIKEIARENNVPIIENKPLARSLYAKVEIGDEIPEEFYQAISKILAMIYLNKK